MYHFFRYPYNGYQPVKYVVNPVRCVEVFLCLVCLCIAGVIIFNVPTVHVAVKVFIGLTAAGFLTITIIDLISTSYMNPIFWNTWILFTMSGSLLFFVCTGLLIAAGSAVLLILATVLNLITAIVFLLDAIFVLNAFRKRQSEVCPGETKPAKEKKQKHSKEPKESKEYVRRSDSKKLCICEISENETSGVPESPSTEIRIFERHIESRRSLHDGKKVDDEKILEQKQRITTSYGGTFHMSKDATPLPSPEASAKPSKSSASQKKSLARGSSSQVITKTSEKVRKGPDGKFCLCDGTPITECETQDGEIIYRDHNGVLYTKDGIPIISSNDSFTETTTETLRQRLSTIKLKSEDGVWYTPDRQRVGNVCRASDGRMVTADGSPLYEIELGDGTAVYESPDGILYSNEGTPIGFTTEREKEFSRNYEKQTAQYTSKAEIHLRELRFGKQTAGQDGDKLYLCDGSTASEIRTPSGRTLYEVDGEFFTRDQIEGQQAIKEPKREKSDLSWNKRPSQDEYASKTTLPTVETSRGDLARVQSSRQPLKPNHSVTIKEPDAGRSKSANAKLSIDSASRITTPSKDSVHMEPARSQASASSRDSVRSETKTPCVCGSRGSSRMYAPDGTPLTEFKTTAGGVLYEGPDGELYTRDGTPIENPRKKLRICPGQQDQTKTCPVLGPKAKTDPLLYCPSPDCMHPQRMANKPVQQVESRRSMCRNQSPRKPQQEERRSMCRSPSPQKPQQEERRRLSVGKEANSRTVAVSTRMVPKCPVYKKCQSAPSSPEKREGVCRPVKSAESPLSQQRPQQPTVVYHQYSQKPCTCGNVHYQQATTVHGTVNPCYPQGREQSPSYTPCGKKDCPATKRLEEQESMEKPPLQTISECDCETDPSTSWDDPMHSTPSGTTSSQQTSSDSVGGTNASPSCDRCYLCGDKSCTIHSHQYQHQQQQQQQQGQQQQQKQAQQPTNNHNSVQTSETRMLRATDIQKLTSNSSNLPGTADD